MSNQFNRGLRITFLLSSANPFTSNDLLCPQLRRLAATKMWLAAIYSDKNRIKNPALSRQRPRIRVPSSPLTHVDSTRFSISFSAHSRPFLFCL